jgi:hypothetical protein
MWNILIGQAVIGPQFLFYRVLIKINEIFMDTYACVSLSGKNESQMFYEALCILYSSGPQSADPSTLPLSEANADINNLNE